MIARSLAVVLLILTLGFAGCIGAKDETKTPIAKANTSSNDTFVRPPDGRSGEISAFSETNKTETGVGGMAHNHDLWAGRTRIVIFEGPSQISPGTSTRDPSGIASGASATISVPRGLLVYEGTGTVEFTISDPARHACEGAISFSNHFICTDDTTAFGGPAPPVAAPDPTGGPAGLKLQYRHAATSTWIDVGELVWGKPSIIKITDAKQTDMPHSTSSLWQFRVASANSYDRTLEFKAKVEIVHGEGPIPIWPGHPQFYSATQHVRDIFEGEATSISGTTSGIANSDEAGPVIPKKLVSYGTRTLHVWANITTVTSATPATAPSSYYLTHTNATGKMNITAPGAKNATIDPTHFYWVLPVRDDDMDSPYQDASRFQFQLNGELGNCINCADYVLKYHLTVKATDVDMTGVYHIHCWDATDC